MSARSRLSTALEDGALVLPDGACCIMRPPAGYDIAALSRDDLSVQHTYRPDVTYWEQSGLAVHKDLPKVAVAIVVVPRAKALAKAMIAVACDAADLVVVDGSKTNGVDSLYKACRKALDDLPCVVKDHGRLFWFAKTAAFAEWHAPAPAPGADGHITQAGVFSEGAIDKGSALLADALPEKLPARMADLGAGWGYLSAQVLQKQGVVSLDVLEAEALSLDCARANITDPRAQFLWEDATQYVPAENYDGIVMNPPFHVGRSADPGLGRAFIQSAARMLTAKGQLWMVANRHLPYEQTLTLAFRDVDMIAQNNAYKVFHAARSIGWT